MKDHRINKLPIQGLEFLFSPPGLPIVDKGAPGPTTSIAILGDAGAGKTTLAAAIAHAIALDLGGIALYLTTELAPTEIKYKASLLAISAKIFSWKHRKQAVAGDIVGQHLVLVEDGDNEPIRRRALEAAWQLVEEPDFGSAPVRCVVIDAFPLPTDAGDGGIRDEVVSIIQALESRGISVVIVQESTGPTDYVPFVTDVVFSLRFDTDGDTGERIRKLSCPKSRYARSFVGPHDTGIDEGHVAVWPDPLSIVTSSRGASVPVVEKPVSVFLPVGGQSYVVEEGGSILLSSMERRGWLIRVLVNTALHRV